VVLLRADYCASKDCEAAASALATYEDAKNEGQRSDAIEYRRSLKMVKFDQCEFVPQGKPWTAWSETMPDSALTAGAMTAKQSPASFVLGTRVSQARVNLISSDSRTGMA